MPTLNNPIQKFFWTNLTREGLDLVDATRVEQLVEYVKQNKVTSSDATPDGAAEVDSFETQALKALLDDNDWRNLLTDDGVQKLETLLGIRTTGRRSGVGRDATGEVPFGSLPGNYAEHIGRNSRIGVEHTAALFNYDYEQHRAEFESPRLSEDERGKKLLFMLQDYAKRLTELGGGPEVANARMELLKAFFDKPAAGVYGKLDPDDDLMNSAWEIVFGTAPDKPESSFDLNKDKQWYAYMSMDGGFIDTAKKVDEYLTLLGKPAKVEGFEKKSPVNWLVGEEPGNTKASSTFSESSAIKSTGVDFAVKLLDNENAVGKRTLDSSVDLKVDFYAWGNFVSLNKRAGDRLVAKHDDTGAELKVSVENVGDNHWKPVFKDASGDVVEPSKVTAVIVGADGQVKGDGVANGSYSASWWGFCDRNAMQGLVTLKYGFEKPSKDVTLTVGDKSVTFTAADITDIVGRRLTEIFPQHNQAGNRYDDEPDQIALKNGEVVYGKIKTNVEFYTPDTYRTGDTMVVSPTGKNAPKGSLLIEMKEERAPGATAGTFVSGPRDVDVSEIAEVRRKLQSGSSALERDAVTIVLKDGKELDGTLKSKLDFAGAEQLADGTLVLKNTDADPLFGDVVITTTKGKERRFSSAEINYFAREDVNEILAEEALAYIIRNKGVFCADSWTASSVANGTRTIEEINRWHAGDSDKPDWVPADVGSDVGHRGKVQNPDNLLFFSLGNKGSSYGGLKFWIETDDNGMPINSKIISGQWDFLWGVEGKPNWNAKATFNPNMPNDLVVKLYVNSVADPEAMKDILPSDWRSHVLPA